MDGILSAAAPSGAREYLYAQSDFERVCRLIYARVGIVLKEGKEDMVYSRLARRLRTLGLRRFRDYLDRLERENDADEWQAFTNALTTNLTSFFREAHHFDVLKTQLQTLPRGRPVKLWSAAASTGEEPYSIAMAALEQLGDEAALSVLSTDVDTQVLEFAQRGVYPMERVSQLPIERLRRHFRRGVGEMQGYCRVNDRLMRSVQFAPLNLLEPNWPVEPPYDAIFCRNVMIYFDKPTQLQILRRLLPLLTPDGLFYAGHSESYFHASDLMKPVGRTVYRALPAALRGARA